MIEVMAVEVVHTRLYVLYVVQAKMGNSVQCNGLRWFEVVWLTDKTSREGLGENVWTVKYVESVKM